MRRRPAWVFALAAIVVVAGVVAIVASGSSSQARPKVLGGNVPVDQNAVDSLSASAYNSPGLVADPKDPGVLAVAARIDAPKLACGLFVSSDGGATWQTRPVPGAPVAADQPPERTAGAIPCFSPDVSFAADGALYVSFASFSFVAGQGNVPDGVWVSRSVDRGATFSTPVKVAGTLSFEPRLVADAETPGRVYVTWVQAAGAGSYGFTGPGNPILVSRSDDGGTTWRSPVTVTTSSRKRPVAPVLVAGRGGALYVSYLDLVDDDLDYVGGHEGRGGDAYPGSWSLVVSTSDDGAASWSESVVDDKLVPTQRVTVLFPPTPAVATDPASGRVYVGFSDARLGDPDVMVWASADGKSWGPGVRVNDTAAKDGTAQYLPALSVSPKGRLDVVYFDRRDDAKDEMNSVSFQSSDDGGKAFTKRLRLTDRTFDSRIGRGADRGLPDLGSRLGVLSATSGALAIWTDTRAGDPVTGRQDLARALVEVPGAEKADTSLRVVGIAAVVLGLLVLGWALFAGRAAASGGAATREG